MKRNPSISHSEMDFIRFSSERHLGKGKSPLAGLELLLP
jgi:hypothetical protein